VIVIFALIDKVIGTWILTGKALSDINPFTSYGAVSHKKTRFFLHLLREGIRLFEGDCYHLKETLQQEEESKGEL